MADLQIGDKAPPFDLPGVDGVNHSMDDFKDEEVLIVAFTCNHCPYAQAYEERIIAIQKDYQDKGVALVAINPNEHMNHPEDGFDNMVIRAEERGFNFPYLRDEAQSAASAYGAERTPEMFLFDSQRTLRYHGRIDDNWEDPDNVKSPDLRNAIDAVLSGAEVAVTETEAVGCTIKWK